MIEWVGLMWWGTAGPTGSLATWHVELYRLWPILDPVHFVTKAVVHLRGPSSYALGLSGVVRLHSRPKVINSQIQGPHSQPLCLTMVQLKSLIPQPDPQATRHHESMFIASHTSPRMEIYSWISSTYLWYLVPWWGMILPSSFMCTLKRSGESTELYSAPQRRGHFKKS